jgi:hypothetical protein
MNLKKNMFRLVYIKLILRDGDKNEYRKVLHFFLTDFVVVMGPCISESEPFVIVQNGIPFDANKVSLCNTVSIHVIGVL